MNLDELFERRGTNCWKWDGEGRSVELPMGCADMDFKMMPEIARALTDKIGEGALTYPVDDGGAFGAFAEYFERHHGIAVDTGHIRYCFGMMCGYSLVLDALTVPGDEVVVQTPVFDYFMDTAENAGRRIVENPLAWSDETNRYEVDFEGLEKALSRPRVKIMLICNPMNPTGTGFRANDLRRIFEMCVEHDVLLMSDEVHSEFYWHGARHESLLQFVPDVSDRCIVMTAPGKTFNIHGLYTSLFIIPNAEVRDAYSVEFSRRHMDLCDLGMVAMGAAYRHGDGYVAEVRDYIAGNLDFVERFFADGSCGVRVSPMEATYLVWLDFRAWGKTSDEIDAMLRDRGLAISKGSNYRTGGQGFMRMDIATQRSRVERACEIIRSAYGEAVR